ncbi:MAG: hypothetical protein AB1481_06330 [Candidatus Omnitrophota bacterium]
MLKPNLKPFFLAALIVLLPLAVFSEEAQSHEARNAAEEIQIINLLNGLDLKKGQMEYILQKAKEANQVREDAFGRVKAQEPDLLKAYGGIKEDVSSGKVTVEKKEANCFHELNTQKESILKNAKATIDGIATEVEGALEPFQLIALDNYKPCIIPITTHNRIGQADPALGIGKVLDKVKAASSQQYAQKRDEFVTRITERIIAKIGPKAEIDKAKINAEVLYAFKKVREMNDVDFQVQKGTIAEELYNKVMPQKVSMARAEKIRKFLLSSNAVAVLETRLNEPAGK